MKASARASTTPTKAAHVQHETSSPSSKLSIAYRVSITSRAARDLTRIYHSIDAKNSDAALHWYRNLKETILSLDEHPNRCPATPEHKQLRHLLYGYKPHIYRVIYRILETRQEGEVLHIRHGARQLLKPSGIR